MINVDVPLVYVYFNKIGFKDGSNVSPIFSINTGLPNYIEFSNVLK